MHYETLDSVVDLVKLYGPGSLIAKADIQDAFRIIPIRPQDYPFLGIMWDGKFYYDKVLPMGESVSCQLFETLSGAVQWMLHEHSENKFSYSAIIFRSVFSGATYRRNRFKKSGATYHREQ